MKAFIIGAGCSGRGLEGPALKEGLGEECDLVFADANIEVVQAINGRHGYEVLIPGMWERAFVKVSEAFDIRNTEKLSRIIQDPSLSLLMTAVRPDNMASVAGAIAMPLYERARRGKPDQQLNVLACEGMRHNTDYFKALVERSMGDKWKDVREAIEGTMGFPNCVVDRICRLGDDGIVRAEDYLEWVVDGERWKGYRFPPIEYVTGSDLEPRMARKADMLTGAHFTIGIVGGKKGIRYVHRALAEDEETEEIVRGQLDEAGFALTRKYDTYPTEQEKYASSIIRRFRNPFLGDETWRLRRNIKRKLGIEERLVEPALWALECGKEPSAIASAITHVLTYNNPRDPNSQEIYKSCAEMGVEETLKHYSGLSDGNPLHSGLIDLVAKKYAIIAK